MHKPARSHPLALRLALCAAALLAGALARADAPPPQTTKDGLVLKKQTATRLVYLRPGARFSQYDRVAVLDCFVQFRKNYARDYNDNEVSLDHQVTDDDIQRMKSAIAAEFKKIFVQQLGKGGYQVVDTAAPDVLVLRPALINVDVTAPDLMTPGIDTTLVRSAGSMTLYLELWDSATNTILARVMDAQTDPYTYARPANRVTNLASADAVLKSWADELVSHLDAVRGTPAAK